MKLIKQPTNNKRSKYLYILEDRGECIHDRYSDREYVACTADGSHFFGREDLVNKGDHGKAVSAAKDQIKRLTTNPGKEYYQMSGAYKASHTMEQFVKEAMGMWEKELAALTTIIKL